MATECISSSLEDVEIAHRLHVVFSDAPLTRFRSELLEVVRSNVEELYTPAEVLADIREDEAYES